MLEIIYGRAGSGKTQAALNRIKERVEGKIPNNYFLVPEQFSFDAEKELCALCGDSLSLFGECLSFTGLARLTDEKLCIPTPGYLDEAGKLLCMISALNGIGDSLKVFSKAERSAETQSSLVSVMDELKTAGLGRAELDGLMKKCGEEGKKALYNKLSDLCIIKERYDKIVSQGKADPSDRLTRLAQLLEQNKVFDKNCFFCIDGFVDFTGQQQRVIYALLESGVDMAVCFTIDKPDTDEIIYNLAEKALHRLTTFAKRQGIPIKFTCCEKEEKGAVDYYSNRIFSWGKEKYNGPLPGYCRSYCADSLGDECENIAARILELVKSTGCKYSEIAVGIRNINEYAPTLMPVLEYYGVPAMLSASVPLLSKSLPALVYGLFEIIEGGWEQDAVISYMRTGLTGLTVDECDLLEGYIYRCRLKSWDWESEDDWKRSPDGFYVKGFSPEDREKEQKKLDEYLAKVNRVRRKLSDPITEYKAAVGISRNDTEEEKSLSLHARFLTSYFNRISLPGRLEEKSKEFLSAGRDTEAKELSQIWKTVVKALEQCASLTENIKYSGSRFGKLFRTVLSTYDIKIIPVALDRVCVGDFDRMRKRNIRFLILAGASEDRLPAPIAEGGIFTGEDYKYLTRDCFFRDLVINFGSSPENRMNRELALIHNTLSMPSEGIIMSYNAAGEDGKTRLPSMVFTGFCDILGTQIKHVDVRETARFAPRPYLSDAVAGGVWQDEYNQIAESFSPKPERLKEGVLAAANYKRGALSKKSVSSLYGDRISLSASRMDTLQSCRFKYFCNYGLKAKRYEQLQLSAVDFGTFVHYILEKVFSSAQKNGINLKRADNDTVKAMVERAVEEYKKSEMIAYEKAPARFKFLFDRLSEDISAILSEFLTELKYSDFSPVHFEYDFSRLDKTKGELLGGKNLRLSGKIDRIDTMEKDGKLYYRIIDYKTSEKKFSLSDVYYGINIQMLLYMYALDIGGEEVFGKKAVPAGIIYMTATDKPATQKKDVEDDALEELQLKTIARSGMVLDNATVLDSWDKSEKKSFIPIKYNVKNGEFSDDNLLSLEKIGKLYRHIDSIMEQCKEYVKQGDISAAPNWKDDDHNACVYCEYKEICLFKDGCSGESFNVIKNLKAEEVWERI